MSITKSLCAATAAIGLFAGTTMADSVGFNTYNTLKAGGTNTAGASINVDVTDSGTTYDFTVTNNSTIASSISQLYFDNSLASVLSGSGSFSNSNGIVLFETGASKNPPVANSIGWTSTLAMFRSVGGNDDFKIKRGINDGGSESLTISFAKVGGTVLADVVNLLTSTGGIVAHLVDLEGNGLATNLDMTTLIAQSGSGSQEDDVIKAVPTPAAALAGLALLGSLATLRRREQA